MEQAECSAAAAASSIREFVPVKAAVEKWELERVRATETTSASSVTGALDSITSLSRADDLDGSKAMQPSPILYEGRSEVFNAIR